MLLTVQQVAELTRVSPETVKKAIKAGELKAVTQTPEGSKKIYYKVVMTDAKEWAKTYKDSHKARGKASINGHRLYAKLGEQQEHPGAQPHPNPPTAIPGFFEKSGGQILVIRELQKQTKAIEELTAVIRHALGL